MPEKRVILENTSEIHVHHPAYRILTGNAEVYYTYSIFLKTPPIDNHSLIFAQHCQGTQEPIAIGHLNEDLSLKLYDSAVNFAKQLSIKVDAKFENRAKQTKVSLEQTTQTPV